MKHLKIILALTFLLSAFSVQAKIETREFTNAQMEEDYTSLVVELRCLVCQNQSLSDSNAELAVDMRTKVFKMLSEGKSKDEIAAFMVARYGDFVLYRPPVKTSTFLLWFGPLIFLVIAAFIVFSFIRRQSNEKPGIDEQEQKKAHSLLDDE
jgi:cytochrome c-type biogenesis protein CcmH